MGNGSRPCYVACNLSFQGPGKIRLGFKAYYHSCQEGLAADYYRQLQKAEREIIQWPEFWKQVGDGYRRRNLERFPYAMIYHHAR